MNPDRQCTATTSAGRRCGHAAIVGGTVCTHHGGNAPQVRAAANRRLAEDRARRHLDDVEVRPIDNPLEAFAQLVAEVVALKNVMASHVASLDDLRADNSKWGTEQMRAEYAALERAQDRAGNLLEKWVRLGLDERLVASRERIEALMMEYLLVAWLTAFEDVGLEPLVFARTHLLLADQLRQLEGLDDVELHRRIEAWHARRDRMPRVPLAALPPGFLDDNPDCAQYVDTTKEEPDGPID